MWYLQVLNQSKTQYCKITCDVSGNLKYVLKDGSSEWWFAVQIRNYPVNIESVNILRFFHSNFFKVEYQASGSTSWIDIPRTSYNYWLADSAGGVATPLSLRITSISGETLVDTDIITGTCFYFFSNSYQTLHVAKKLRGP